MKMISDKPKILLVKTQNRTFIQRDLDILEKHFEIKTVDLEFRTDNLFSIFILIKLVYWSDVVFTWFASYHALISLILSKFFKKKIIVVVGGYEVAKVPEIEYGLLLNPIFSLGVKFILKNANKILTVDESLKNDAIKNLSVDGYNIITIPTSYNFEKFKPNGLKQDIVMTVGFVSYNNIKRKGFYTFVEAANYLPEIQFLLIGEFVDDSIEYLKKIAPKNVTFMNYLPEAELIRFYQKAKVYCQISLYEGLPNALCEAMLCECVPVGTPICGIPNAMGSIGFYAPYGDIKKTAEMIACALRSNNGEKARLRIKEMFPIEKREKELVNIIKYLAE